MPSGTKLAPPTKVDTSGTLAPLTSRSRLTGERKRMKHRLRIVGLVGGLALIVPAIAQASVPQADVRLTNDTPASSGYVSNYTMNTGAPYTDATLTECSRSRGRQNEPAVAADPRN